MPNIYAELNDFIMVALQTIMQKQMTDGIHSVILDRVARLSERPISVSNTLRFVIDESMREGGARSGNPW